MHGSSQFSDRNVKDSGLFCEYYSDIIQHPSGTEFSFFIQTWCTFQMDAIVFPFSDRWRREILQALKTKAIKL